MRSKLRLPSPAMVVAVISLVVASSGVTIAATSLPRDSVNSATVSDNSIRSGDIRNGQVKHVDLGNNSVKTENVSNNSILGDDILESSLGEVPQAQRAIDADKLGGRPASQVIDNHDVVPIVAKGSFGQKSEIFRKGAIAIELDCRADVSGSNDQVRLLAHTTEAGAFMDGDSNHTGPGNGSDFLEPTTPEDARQISDGLTSVPGGAALEFDIDTAFVAGPNQEYIGLDETWAFGLNVYGADCFVAGYLTVLGPGAVSGGGIVNG